MICHCHLTQSFLTLQEHLYALNPGFKAEFTAILVSTFYLLLCFPITESVLPGDSHIRSFPFLTVATFISPLTWYVRIVSIP